MKENFKLNMSFMQLKIGDFCQLLLLSIVVFLSGLSMAGSEGDVIMTYYFDSPLDKDLTVTINTELDHQCMYDYEISGQKEFTIPKGTIGFHELNTKNAIHYEAKSSSTDGTLCATDPSYFHVEVNAEDTRYSFTSPLAVNTGNWFYPNSAKLYFYGDAPASQSICTGASFCSSKSYEYHYTNTPTIHVIYRPTY